MKKKLKNKKTTKKVVVKAKSKVKVKKINAKAVAKKAVKAKPKPKVEKKEALPKKKTIGHNPLIDYLDFSSAEQATSESAQMVRQAHHERPSESQNNQDEIRPAHPERSVAESNGYEREVVSEKAQKERITLHISAQLIDRFKNAVFWQPGLTLASFAEAALSEALNKVEQERGMPFPSRTCPLKSGRPIK